MKLTPEQLKEKREKAAREREEQQLKYPYARLGQPIGDDGSEMQLVFLPGVAGLQVEYSGRRHFTRAFFVLRDPLELVYFMEALTARYNALIDDMNEAAGSCALKEPAKILNVARARIDRQDLESLAKHPGDDLNNALCPNCANPPHEGPCHRGGKMPA